MRNFTILFAVIILGVETWAADKISFKAATKNVCIHKLAYLKDPSANNKKTLEKHQSILKSGFSKTPQKEIDLLKSQIKVCQEVAEFKKQAKLKKQTQDDNKKETPQSEVSDFQLAVKDVCQKKLSYLKDPNKAREKELKKAQSVLSTNFKQKKSSEISKMKGQIRVCKEVVALKREQQRNGKKQAKKLSDYDQAVDAMCLAKVEHLQAPTAQTKTKLAASQKALHKNYPQKKSKDLIKAKELSKNCAQVQTLKQATPEDKKKKRWVSQDITKNTSKTETKTKVIKAKPQKLDMYLNIGVGPQMSSYSSPLSDKNLFGLGFDLFYVIPAKSLKKHHGSLPGFMKKTHNANEDYEYAPFGVLALMPTKVTLNPKLNGTTSSYGITFGALGYYKTFAPQSKFRLKTGVKLPVVNYEYLDSDYIQGGPIHFLGVGAAVELKGIVKLNDTWNVSLEWHGQGHLPLKDTEVINASTGEKENLWYKNTFGVLFHYKLPWIKEL